MSPVDPTSVLNGAMVRRLRLRLHLTQKELGAACGTFQQHISAMERGRKVQVYPATLARLAAVLGVSMEALVEEKRGTPGRQGEDRACPGTERSECARR